jgi:hypothetical protein
MLDRKDFVLKPLPSIDRWTMKLQGNLLSVKHLTDVKRPPPKGPRGNCKGFTRAVRLRLLKLIATIDWEKCKRGVFVTLTYPDGDEVPTFKQRNKDRYLFWRYVEKYLGRKLPTIWRCEWKPRLSGANKGIYYPHFHLLMMGVEYVSWETIRSWWRTITKKEGALATDIRRVEAGKMAALYVSKYVGKVDQLVSLDNASYLNNAGRQWGVLRRGMLPRFPVHYVDDLTVEIVAHLRRAAGACLPWYDPTVDEGFTLLGERAKALGNLLLAKGLDYQTFTG